MPPPMASTPSSGGLIFKDLVLIGGGHSHAHVLKMWGMQPEPGVQLTLITRDVDTPYSGMLPGYVAGAYTWRECHIDLAKLAAFSGARLVHAEACGLDLKEKRVLLKGRPPIAYDVLSIDIGSAPKPVVNADASAAHAPTSESSLPSVTPVKPIDGFCKRWDAILARVLSLPSGAKVRVSVVGAGAGGVELALSMQARLRRELVAHGRRAESLELSLIGRRLMPQHAAGVRSIFEAMLVKRGVRLLLGRGVSEATPTELRCTDGSVVTYDEAIWCTQGGAADWLRQTGLALDPSGFIAVHPTLESISSPSVFAAGDVAAVLKYPRPKAGVFAVRQGMPLANNLRRSLLGQPLAPFVPQSSFLGLIGDGDGACVASRGAMALEASWLWTLKDHIDRTWMYGYQDGLPPPMSTGGMGMSGDAADPPPVALASGQEALDALSHASMRCGGCGAKVGVSVLNRVMARLREGSLLPADPPAVILGLDAPDDCAVLAPSSLASVHTVDFFRSLIDDPFVFGQVAANHALSDCHAMNAQPIGALAIAVVPYGLDAKVEECLFQMMAGASRTLSEAGCSLLGGHSCEGADLSLGFAVTGSAPAEATLKKSGLLPGQSLILTKPLGTGTLFAANMRGKSQGAWMAEATASMVASNRLGAAILAEHGAAACTDVTGFGLLGHLYELASASQARVLIRMGSLPLLRGAIDLVGQGIFSSLQPANLRLKRAVANEKEALVHPAYPLLFDPQTAGGLLASVPAQQADACLQALREAGYAGAAVVGEVLELLPEGVCVPGLIECQP
uniref:Selenide, water dikinase n=1 Tax=Haptolina brevifila TaxID=156173 RepID=A0A7S2I9W4_9EUKA